VPCIGPATCSGEISSIAANYCDGAGSCSTTETVNCKSAERCGVNADGRCAMPYFTQVDMGYENTCALRSDGELYCWGLNAFGQLAVADLGAQSGPVRFPTTKPVRSVAVGFWHICVLHWDGQVDCWGHNGYDALGCETQVLEQQHCTPLKAGSSAVEIASANTHTCVRMENGTVKCWGRNDYGQLGSNNSIVPYSTGPVDVVGVTTARSLSVGLWHAGVIIGNSGVKTWGNNDHGQLGIESPPSIAYSAMLVTGLSGATAQLSATGTYHSCALLKDQSVWCFGDNTRGAFGYGSATYYDHPIQVRSSSAGVRAVATGDSITCTLTGEATVACSGKNDMGSLGDGTFEDSSTPVIVKWPVASMPRLRNIVAKYTSACAISESGRIWCWGDGTATGVPIEVTQP
jgi:alpha-tubulin suppressor-like RCC1 family protein